MKATILAALSTAARQYRHLSGLLRSTGLASTSEAANYLETQAASCDKVLEVLDYKGPGFDLQFSAGTDSFADFPEAEAARILREVADSIEQKNRAGNVRDQNGNTVGNWSFTAPGD